MKGSSYHLQITSSLVYFFLLVEIERFLKGSWYQVFGWMTELWGPALQGWGRDSSNPPGRECKFAAMILKIKIRHYHPIKKRPLMDQRSTWGLRVSCHHWNWSPRHPSARGSYQDILLANLCRLVSPLPNSFLFNKDNFIELTDKNITQIKAATKAEACLVISNTHLREQLEGPMLPTPGTVGTVQCLPPQGQLELSNVTHLREQLEWPLWGPGVHFSFYIFILNCIFIIYLLQKRTMSESNLEE